MFNLNYILSEFRDPQTMIFSNQHVARKKYIDFQDNFSKFFETEQIIHYSIHNCVLFSIYYFIRLLGGDPGPRAGSPLPKPGPGA